MTAPLQGLSPVARAMIASAVTAARRWLQGVGGNGFGPVTTVEVHGHGIAEHAHGGQP